MKTYLHTKHLPPRPLSAIWFMWAWEISRAVWHLERGVWDGVVYVLLVVGFIGSLVDIVRGEFYTPKWEAPKS